MNPPDGYRMATAAELDCLPAGALCLWKLDAPDPDNKWNPSGYVGEKVDAAGREDCYYAVPITSPATGIEAQVCADIAARQQRGIQKYGTTVQDNPLPLKAWLQHAYEEALDHAIYLKRAIAEL